MMLKALGAALLAALPSSAALAWQSALPAGGDSTAVAWAYQGERGPEHWAALAATNAACGAGLLQSPVALDSRQAIPIACQPLKFLYRSSSLFMKNDDHTLRLGYDRGSYLEIDGLAYELAEVLFHVPAEHMLDGRVADGEMQLIHGNNHGDIAIVAVPLVVGQRSNQTLRRILEYAPTTAGESFYGRNIGINPMFLLPGRRGYLSYEGSLTRPPCTEGVHWFVLSTPLEVDQDDFQHLATLTHGNVRPLQPLGNRPAIKAACGQ